MSGSSSARAPSSATSAERASRSSDSHHLSSASKLASKFFRLPAEGALPSDPSKFLSVPPCPACAFQLAVETINCTAWSSIESWEHRLVSADDIAKAGQWALKRGWKARFAPALRTSEG
eukprot:8463804-Pyramimonas_sp.AAC.1